MTGTWVVTGGAGYIGGHVVAALRREGVRVVALDDLSAGRAERLPLDVPLVRGRVGDPRVLRSVLAGAAGGGPPPAPAGAPGRGRVGDPRVLRSVLAGAAGVVHLAALTSAPESVRDPLAYYRANVTDTATLLTAMADAGVARIVASSSAAVYGSAADGALTEQN